MSQVTSRFDIDETALSNWDDKIQDEFIWVPSKKAALAIAAWYAMRKMCPHREDVDALLAVAIKRSQRLSALGGQNRRRPVTTDGRISRFSHIFIHRYFGFAPILR
jgi:hypothetical protein